jgi:hypothetical protein
MINFSFTILNPFSDFDKQKTIWRLFKSDLPFNNITIYKHTSSILGLSCYVNLENFWLEIGLFGYILLLDKS